MSPALTGDRVALGPLQENLLATYQRWFNDFELNRTWGFPQPRPSEAMTAWLRSRQEENDTVWFTVWLRETQTPIGLTALRDIDKRNGSALFTIVIGERSAHHRGFGTETVQLVVDYAFQLLGLHSLLLRVDAFNHAGRRAYERVGFHAIGRRRGPIEQLGETWDTIYMECLASTFDS